MIETPVTLAERREWLAARRAGGFAVLVAEVDGQVLGFGSYGIFRPYEGFRQTVEHSLYVASIARAQGVRPRVACRFDRIPPESRKEGYCRSGGLNEPAARE